MPVIETGPDEWRSSARPSSYTRVPSRPSPACGEGLGQGWWEVDGIEPLAKKDCVYSAATAPACPYLHFPNWRKREVLIPNGARPSISLRTSARTPVRLRFRVWWKAERTMLIRPRAYHSHSKRCRHPDRLTFQHWRSGEVSIPTRCRAARFQNPLPSHRRPLRIWRSLGDSN
jgi:hypothetical protein